MTTWYTTNQLYEEFGIKPPTFSQRNVVLYLADVELIVMPQNANIGLNLKKNSDYSLAVPLSKTIIIYQFNQKSLSIFKEFAHKFPEAFKLIIEGSVTSESNPEVNANQYVVGLSNEHVQSILEWKKTILIKEPVILERFKPIPSRPTFEPTKIVPKFTPVEQTRPEKPIRKLRELTLGDFMKTYQKQKKPVKPVVIQPIYVEPVINLNIAVTKPKKKKITKMKKGILKDRESIKAPEVENKDIAVEEPVLEPDLESEHVEPLKEETAILDVVKTGSNREYVQQDLSPELDLLVTEVLAKLYKFQKTLKQMNPRNYKVRKRLVFGLREVLRAWKQKLLKSIIIAPNIEQGDTLDGILFEILDNAFGRIPIIYALNMKKIGKALGKQIKISIVGVLSADGAMDEYRKMLGIAKEKREKYALDHVTIEK
jgi:ribosomal protein L7Ae-like RNA K-turn-binding protein